jgi:hypothetical protein
MVRRPGLSHWHARDHHRPGQPDEFAVRLERWIDPAARHWYSGDHHVHAAGCSHYQDPTQGVGPDDIVRQVLGERLNIGSILTWGPCYYHQKQFFSGKDDERSTADMKLRYDLEVSGFPSSHAGHLVLLGLKEQDYPGTRRIEDWPTWTSPILQWAHRQGAVTGYAHSGWGLQIADRTLPSDEVPAFDGIGANEFIVTVTQPDTVDFISSVDTPWPWELNIWYHVLNVGFRTRISGETDFPCIYDDRVGLGRTYAKLDRLTFDNWLDAIRAGRSYVSDGRSHLMDFAVNGVAVGGADVKSSDGHVQVTLNAAARLDEKPAGELASKPDDQKPYWDLERARVGQSRDVQVEFLIDGHVAATRTLAADGHGPRPCGRTDASAERMGRRAHPALVSHEPDLGRGGRQTHAPVATKRAVVPQGRGPVLAPEEQPVQGRRAGRGRGRVRPCACELSAADRGGNGQVTCFRSPEGPSAQRVLLFALSLAAAGGAGILAQSPIASPPLIATDRRLTPLKNLDGEFLFQPIASPDAWKARSAELRRQLQVALGLWPMPEATPLNAVVHGAITRQGYTVEKVYFESLPGHFVTGSLYRPTGRQGRLPAVLCRTGTGNTGDTWKRRTRSSSTSS